MTNSPRKNPLNFRAGLNHRADIQQYLFFAFIKGVTQDCRITTGQISLKIGGRVKHGPRKNPFHFGLDVNKKNSLFKFHDLCETGLLALVECCAL